MLFFVKIPVFRASTVANIKPPEWEVDFKMTDERIRSDGC